MKNIELISSCCHEGLPKHAQLCCVDSLKDDVYFATHDEVIRLNCKSQEAKSCHSLVDHGLSSERKIISLTCLTDQDSLCIITDAGEITLHNLSTFDTETVGSFDDGLKIVSWSPDGNTLVLITGSDTIIYMNRDFEIRQEIPLYSSLDVGDEAVSVGWGKKETQFHGSEGKSAAKKTDKKVSSAFEWDDLQHRISWQGDGQLLAVSCVSESRRQVRIFSCEGSLKAISEPLNGLEMEIDWKPSGSLIAAVQRTPAKYQVVFLERNGLQHGEFSLPFKQNEAIVKQLMWSPDSTLLALRIDNLSKNEQSVQEEFSKIFIFSCRNYHWYLKQTLQLNEPEKFAKFLWHPERSNALLYLTSAGFYRECNWDWRIHKSYGFSKENKAYAAVIDADQVLLTPFRNKIVPPPHALHTCKLPNFVNSVAFPSFCDEGADKLAVVLANNCLAVISIENDKPCIRQILSLSWDESVKHPNVSFLHHWAWIGPNLLTAIYSENYVSYRCDIVLDGESASVKLDSLRKEAQVTGACVTSDGKMIYQLHDGSLLSCCTGVAENSQLHSAEAQFSPVARFPRQCYHMESCHVSGHDLVFGITKHFQLFCGSIELMKNCSSFALHDKFLVAMSLDHKLHCISLAFCKEIATGKQTGALLESVDNLRSTERGSHIVTCVPEDTRVILQMPRGNLECIHPRALLVTTVAGHLQNLKFHDAFSLMRRHRINLNLLFDHDPELFLNNTEKFIADVGNVNWLNVFLSDLSDDNIVTTLYAKIYSEIKNHQLGSYPNKLNVICEKMRQTLQALDSKKFLLVILSTYVLSKPPALEDALKLINGLKGGEDSESTVDAALMHLTYLVDVNQLFDIAIGTYDFDLVIMVAQKTQKDPKEYLPFLNELKLLEENYRRFKIDNHLKRPAKALENIAKAGDVYFDECLAHIKNHRLYKYALSLYEKGSNQYKVICSAYGDHLKEQRRYDEAGIFYVRGGLRANALEAFEKSLDWQQAVVLASAQLDPAGIVQLGSRLAQKLKETNQYRDAAYLLEAYAKNPQEGIFTLIEGHEWLLALEMIHKHNKGELVQSHLLPALRQHSTSVHHTITSMKALFQRHADRLTIVRENKRNAQHSFGQSEDVDDSASEITSITESSARSYISSATSRMTGRTSKNRRKEERKKHSLKEGSYYEDRALVEALNEIAVNADHLKEECSSLTRLLLLNSYDEDASLLQNGLFELLSMIKENVHNIWLAPLENLKVTLESLNPQQPSTETNSQSFNEDLKRMLPPSARSIKWEVDFLKAEND